MITPLSDTHPCEAIIRPCQKHTIVHSSLIPVPSPRVSEDHWASLRRLCKLLAGQLFNAALHHEKDKRPVSARWCTKVWIRGGCRGGGTMEVSLTDDETQDKQSLRTF